MVHPCAADVGVDIAVLGVGGDVGVDVIIGLVVDTAWAVGVITPVDEDVPVAEAVLLDKDKVLDEAVPPGVVTAPLGVLITPEAGTDPLDVLVTPEEDVEPPGPRDVMRVEAIPPADLCVPWLKI